MSEREITVRKQASGSNLRDGARTTLLDKKNLIEMFNMTYAELGILLDQMYKHLKLCTLQTDIRVTKTMMKRIKQRRDEMLKAA